MPTSDRPSAYGSSRSDLTSRATADLASPPAASETAVVRQPRKIVSSPCPATKQICRPAKPFWRDRDVGWKQIARSFCPLIQPWSSVMWAFILNLIYDKSCQDCLANLARHQHRWI